MPAQPPEPVQVPVSIETDHPAFAGHFPGRPVVPAVVLLAEALAEIARATSTAVESWTVVNAKFVAPVGPGATLTLLHAPTPSGGRRFEFRAGEAVVASGALARKVKA